MFIKKIDQLIHRYSLCAIVMLLILICFSNVFALDAEMVWVSNNQDGSKIYISRYSSGEWGENQMVKESSHMYLLPALGSNTRGERLLVWVEVSPSGRQILKYAFNKKAKWSRTLTLTDRLQVNLAPVVVYDAADTPYVIWSANDGDDDDIYISSWRNRSWAEPVRINTDNDLPDILPEAGTGLGGELWVRWKALNQRGEYVEMSRSFNPEEVLSQGFGFSTASTREKRAEVTPQEAGIVTPEFYYGKSRATIHFPGNPLRQSITLKGRDEKAAE